MQAPPIAAQRLAWFLFIALSVVWVDYSSAERRADSQRDNIALCDKANLGRASLVVAAERRRKPAEVIFYQRINPIVDCAFSQYRNGGKPVPLTGERLQRFLNTQRVLYPPNG